MLAFQGHPGGGDTRHGNDTPERYLPVANRWVSLPGVGDVSIDPILYPRLHLLRNGQVFVSSRIPGWSGNITVDPRSGAVAVVSPLPDAAYHGFDCPSVLLPLLPGDGYRPRVLLCGGLTSQLIDLGEAHPAWRTVPRQGSTAGRRRIHACATLLPTGDVLLTGGSWGGTGAEFDDQQGVFEPELYRTPLTADGSSYTGDAGRWETIGEPATVLRNYHSTALLMPDGRVWTAGGNSAAQPGSPPGTAQKLVEIYDPPYPAGPRPRVTACPTFVTYNIRFRVGVSDAEQIARAVLMRCGSSTHAFDPDQRAVVLSYQASGPREIVVVAPPNGAVAPPGAYMLFVLDRQGRPCGYAPFLRLGENRWSQFELAPAGSAALGGGVAAISRVPNSMELWWVGQNGSVEGAYWYDGWPWQRYERAPAHSAASGGGIAAVSRIPTSMELWWVGENGSVQDAYWYEQ